MNTGYTHKINLYRKISGLGWMFQSFPTTSDAVRAHMSVLYKQQTAGSVRNIELVKLTW
jgi:hypothetical protein